MTTKKQSYPSPFLAAIEEYIRDREFYDAADSLLLLIRAFDFEKAIFEFVKEQLDEMSYEDQEALITELIHQTKWSEAIAEAFSPQEGWPKVQSFTEFLSMYLSSRADLHKNNNETDKQPC